MGADRDGIGHGPHRFAHVGYVSRARMIGISKMTRWCTCSRAVSSSRRSVSEQIVNALVELIDPHGVAVHLEAVHLGTQMRGVREEHSMTATGIWRRGYTLNPELRREFPAEGRTRNP